MERLDPRTTVLLVVDVQEKLAPAMAAEPYAALLKNTTMLLEAARILGVRVLASEQYPKGLGATVPTIAEHLHDAPRLAKTTFDACSDLGIARALAERDPRAVVVVGMETHVCVFQTARELVKRGFATHVVADAVASRREEHRALGLRLCEQAGAYITPAETVAFDWLGQAGTDAFKRVSRLLR